MISYTVALQKKKFYKSGPSNLLLDKIYSTDAFNIKVFVAASSESSP